MFWLTIVAWAGSALQGASLTLRSSSRNRASTESEAADPQHSCLDGKRIVFIGPSTSKSDYLALAFFAEYGRWPDADTVEFGKPAYSSGPNPLYAPNLEYRMGIAGQKPAAPVHPCKTGTAENSFWYSNHMLNGNEVCDCYKQGDWIGPVDVNNQTENRVYNNGKTMIAYFQWLGDVIQPRGTFSLWPLQQKPMAALHQQCPAGQFKGSWDWSMNLPDFISSTVAHFQPTHLVVDAAYWPVQPHNTAFWNAVAQTGISAVLNTQGKVLWRVPPLRIDYPIPVPSSQVDLHGFAVKGWKLYDASNIVSQYRAQGIKKDSDIFWDNTHLKPKAQTFLMKGFLDTYVCPIR